MTTGSLIHGLEDGLKRDPNITETQQSEDLYWINGNPSGVYSTFLSGIGVDVSAGSIFMCKSGLNWIALGSVAF